jgi:tetratricopeptide (TPR) repeat protein
MVARPARAVPMLATLAVFLFPLPGSSASDPEPDVSARPVPLSPTILRLRNLFVAGQVDAAREQVQKLIEANPDDARSLALLGDILFRQAKFADAEQAYRRAVQADRQDARGHWGLGRLDMLASRSAAARDHIANAFQLDPRDPDIVLSYADLVQDIHSRVVLLRNFLILAAGRNEDRERMEDAVARLEITERLGHLDSARLASPYQSYRLKLGGYFPDGSTQSGLVVGVSLNGGKPLRLILDSGADGIFVSNARARAANMERITADRVTGAGSGSNGKAWMALARHVTMGPLDLEDCLVHVTETSAFTNADGVIGMNVFEKFLVRLDPASQTLDLLPFADERTGVPGAADMVRAYRVGHLLLVKASLDNRSDRQYFLLDTGASFSATPGPAAWESRDGAAIEIRGAAGRVDGALRAQPMRLTIEGRQLVDERPVKLDLTELSRHEGVEISGIIGYPPLGNTVLTINYRDGLIQFGRPNR